MTRYTPFSLCMTVGSNSSGPGGLRAR